MGLGDGVVSPARVHRPQHYRGGCASKKLPRHLVPLSLPATHVISLFNQTPHHCIGIGWIRLERSVGATNRTNDDSKRASDCCPNRHTRHSTNESARCPYRSAADQTQPSTSSHVAASTASTRFQPGRLNLLLAQGDIKLRGLPPLQ